MWLLKVVFYKICVGLKRHDEQVPYGAFFTEKWANQLGEQVTGEESIGDLVLD